ncbi:MAG: ArsA family ATPase [Myxococcota bacterium]
MNLFDRKLLFVIGKGGVGRTTVAITLAMAAARRGKRVGLLELYGNNEVGRRYGLTERSYAPREVVPGVKHQSLTPYECLDDFGRQKLKVGALVKVLFNNRVFHAFVDAVPGLHDLFQLGKINNLAVSPHRKDPVYDIIIIDAPATGHGLTLLDAAGSMSEMVGGGLVGDEAGDIQALVRDPTRTGLVLATLPDELPVNESLELIEGLGAHKDQLVGAIVNQVRSLDVPEDPAWAQLRERLTDAALVELGDDLLAIGERQRDACAKLKERLPQLIAHRVPILELPRAEPQELTTADLPRLAETLLQDYSAWERS